MRCREFRNKHVAYVDDVLPSIEMEAMRRHAGECARCAKQDTLVRRSLLLVRNLPAVEPSPDFMRRLNARLAERPDIDAELAWSRGRVSGAARIATTIAAGLLLVSYIVLRVSDRPGAVAPRTQLAVITLAPPAQ